MVSKYTNVALPEELINEIDLVVKKVVWATLREEKL